MLIDVNLLRIYFIFYLYSINAILIIDYDYIYIISYNMQM